MREHTRVIRKNERTEVYKNTKKIIMYQNENRSNKRMREQK